MFVCEIPRRRSDVSKIAEIEQRLFGDITLRESDALPVYEKCSEYYCVLYDQSGEVSGYSIIFPMQENFYSEFIKGSITEEDIKPYMLLCPKSPEFTKAHHYVSSVVVLNHFDVITRSILVTSLLSWRMTQMDRLSLRRVPVFMMTATEEGDQMVRFVGAKKISDGKNRKDRKAVYGRTITPGFVMRANAKLHRCLTNGLVRMNFENCCEAKT
jgi:hypothetical protein